MPPAKSHSTKNATDLKQLPTSNKKKNKYFFKTSAHSKTTETPTDVKKSTVKPPKNFARLPTKPDEASSNWKMLSEQIKPVHSKGRLLYLERKKKAAQLAEKLVVEEKAKVTSQETSMSENTSTELEIWFDDVDPILLDVQTKSSKNEVVQVEINGQSMDLTKILALDCEMVGVGTDGKESALARVSIVNQHGECVYDKFVAPGDEVTDYRTQFSGIRPHNLKNANELGTVCHEVAAILRGRILVGHGLGHDLEVLMIKHPKSNIRDTSKYKLFRTIVNGATPSLKRLAQQFLGIEIQSGEHSSVQDAQAALRLYTMFRQQWETDLATRRSERKTRIVKGKNPNKDDNPK